MDGLFRCRRVGGGPIRLCGTVTRCVPPGRKGVLGARFFYGGRRKCHSGNVDIVMLARDRLGKVADGEAVSDGVVLVVEA